MRKNGKEKEITFFPGDAGNFSISLIFRKIQKTHLKRLKKSGKFGNSEEVLHISEK